VTFLATGMVEIEKRHSIDRKNFTTLLVSDDGMQNVSASIRWCIVVKSRQKVMPNVS
jgi:hypothetical protein